MRDLPRMAVIVKISVLFCVAVEASTMVTIYFPRFSTQDLRPLQLPHTQAYRSTTDACLCCPTKYLYELSSGCRCAWFVLSHVCYIQRQWSPQSRLHSCSAECKAAAQGSKSSNEWGYFTTKVSVRISPPPISLLSEETDLRIVSLWVRLGATPGTVLFCCCCCGCHGSCGDIGNRPLDVYPRFCFSTPRGKETL